MVEVQADALRAVERDAALGVGALDVLQRPQSQTVPANNTNADPEANESASPGEVYPLGRMLRTDAVDRCTSKQSS